MSISCTLEDSVPFEPLSGVTSIFFDDKSFQVKAHQSFVQEKCPSILK